MIRDPVPNMPPFPLPPPPPVPPPPRKAAGQIMFAALNPEVIFATTLCPPSLANLSILSSFSFTSIDQKSQSFESNDNKMKTM